MVGPRSTCWKPGSSAQHDSYRAVIEIASDPGWTPIPPKTGALFHAYQQVALECRRTPELIEAWKVVPITAKPQPDLHPLEVWS